MRIWFTRISTAIAVFAILSPIPAQAISCSPSELKAAIVRYFGIYTDRSLGGLAEAPPRLPWDLTRKIDLSRITDQKVIPTTSQDGRGFFQIREGMLEGKKVFIKISLADPSGKDGLRTTEDVEKECYWLEYLNRNGWGPKLKGTTMIGGRYAIVMENVPGMHISVPYPTARPSDFAALAKTLPKDFHAKQSLINDLIRFRDFCFKHDIYPEDLQLRMTSSHAVVIDPEFYSFLNVPPGKRNIKNEAYENIDRFIKILLETKK